MVVVSWLVVDIPKEDSRVIFKVNDHASEVLFKEAELTLILEKKLATHWEL
jgi:hypothetical protein